MKMIKTVLSEHIEYSTLIRAVVCNVGKESISDINSHGIDGGFGGFIYYTDTVKFFKAHKKAILSLLKALSEDVGEGLLELVAGFNCLSSAGKPIYTVDEIAEAIYTGRGDYAHIIQNALAWFAAEEVCRWFEE